MCVGQMVGGPMRVDSWQPPYKVHSPPSPWQGSDLTDSLTRPWGETLTEVSKSQVLALVLLVKTEPPLRVSRGVGRWSWGQGGISMIKVLAAGANWPECGSPEAPALVPFLWLIKHSEESNLGGKSSWFQVTARSCREVKPETSNSYSHRIQSRAEVKESIHAHSLLVFCLIYPLWYSSGLPREWCPSYWAESSHIN